MDKPPHQILSKLAPVFGESFFWRSYTEDTKNNDLKTGSIISIIHYHEGFRINMWKIARNIEHAFGTLMQFDHHGKIDFFAEMMAVPKGEITAPRGKDRYLMGKVAEEDGTVSRDEVNEKVKDFLRQFDLDAVEIELDDPNHPKNRGWLLER